MPWQRSVPFRKASGQQAERPKRGPHQHTPLTCLPAALLPGATVKSGTGNAQKAVHCKMLQQAKAHCLTARIASPKKPA